MKSQLLSLFLLLGGLLFLQAQDCPPISNPNVTTQADVDAITANLEECNTITGSITIFQATEDLDLSGWVGINHIEGDLVINANPLQTSVQGLENLVSIGGSFRIQSNLNLTTYGIFDNLVSVAENFYISASPLVESFSENAFSQFTEVGVFLLVQMNVSEIPTFPNLTSCTQLSLSQMESLIEISGFNALTELGGLTISPGSSLTTISGFENLEIVTSKVTIQFNGVLNDISGFESLTNIGGELKIVQNPQLNDCCVFSELLSEGNVGSSFIFSNAANCFSTSAIDAYCNIPMGCTDMNACNYDPEAEQNDGSCEYSGCTNCPGLSDALLVREGALVANTDIATDGNEEYTWYDGAGNEVFKTTGIPYFSPSIVPMEYSCWVYDPDADCTQVFLPRMVLDANGCCDFD
ncbi:hypothetical protein N8482_00895 [Chitinophagales bacterium]|nr:hypothetical protein [Chitinophagales bacterium]